MNAYNDPHLRTEKLNELMSSDMVDLAEFFGAICEQDENMQKVVVNRGAQILELQDEVSTLLNFVKYLMKKSTYDD
jgi:hypothetical protein